MPAIRCTRLTPVACTYGSAVRRLCCRSAKRSGSAANPFSPASQLPGGRLNSAWVRPLRCSRSPTTSAGWSYGNRNSTAVKPAFAAASKRSRNGTSLNIIVRLAAKRGIPCPSFSIGLLRLTRKLRPGDARIHSRHRSIIIASHAGGCRHQKHLQCRCCDRHRKSCGARHVLDDAEVLYENLHRAARGVITVEHVRHSVLEHPRVSGGGRDDLVHLADIEALLGRKSHCFRRHGNVDPRKQLVDHLERGALARGIAKFVEFCRHGIERRPCLRESGRTARGENSELTLRRALRTPADWSIEIMPPGCLQLFRQAARDIRVHGRGGNEDGILGQGFGGAA